jgi:hypothetical protein
MTATALFRAKAIALIIVLATGIPGLHDLSAQNKKTTTYEQIWLGYFNQSRFSGKWGSWVDLHLRTEDDFVQGLSQGIIRLGLTYYIRDQVKATVGYAYVNHFPGDNHKNISMPEHRPWQQLQWHNNNKRVRTMQWLRLEERFRRKILNDDELADGYNFNFRVRYNYFIQWAIGSRPFQKGSFSYVLNDEVHINFGKQIVYNYFDQNRFFTGFQYFFSDHANLQFGYMNLFQQTAAGNRYRSLHTMRLFFFQNLDFRKKKG